MIIRQVTIIGIEPRVPMLSINQNPIRCHRSRLTLFTAGRFFSKVHTVGRTAKPVDQEKGP